jgi:hypothetical protein
VRFTVCNYELYCPMRLSTLLYFHFSFSSACANPGFPFACPGAPSFCCPSPVGCCSTSGSCFDYGCGGVCSRLPCTCSTNSDCSATRNVQGPTPLCCDGLCAVACSASSTPTPSPSSSLSPGASPSASSSQPPGVQAFPLPEFLSYRADLNSYGLYNCRLRV